MPPKTTRDIALTILPPEYAPEEHAICNAPCTNRRTNVQMFADSISLPSDEGQYLQMT